jgi:hypothetical protein
MFARSIRTVARAATGAALPLAVVVTPLAAQSPPDGREIVEQVCGECHSMDPPPNKAPPLTHLARHLRSSFDEVDEAVAHVLAYAPAPDASRSILPARAIERFGLMPPQPLPAPLLEAAARYIWSLEGGMRGGPHRRRGGA